MKLKPLSQTIFLISMAASYPAAYAEEEETPKSKTEQDTVQAGSLTAMISSSVTFTTLTKALKAAELDVILGKNGEFTVFAPTDDAFGKLPTGVLTKLMLPENKEKLRSLLLYHVVAGKLLAADLIDGDVKTMNGEKIDVDVKTDEVQIDGSKVFNADVTANNGVMHSLGEVLIPESLEGFEGLTN